MRYLTILCFLSYSTLSTAQLDSFTVVNQQLFSFNGINLAHLEIDVKDFETSLNQITIDHILFWGIESCDIAVVAQCLEQGANPNMISSEDDHILTELAFCDINLLPLTKMMVSAGGDVNGADSDNESFLSYVIYEDDIRVVEYLINQGARIDNIGTDMQCLPVHSITSVEMAKLFQKLKIDLNQNCGNGRNLLHFAAKRNQAELVRYLVSYNLVSRDQKDEKGRSPLDFAKLVGNSIVIDLLSN